MHMQQLQHLYMQFVFAADSLHAWLLDKQRLSMKCNLLYPSMGSRSHMAHVATEGQTCTADLRQT